MKLALGIEYDGSNYHGWQTQSDVETVQDCLEKALGKIADHTVRVHCAGRTDTRVHGLGQVVHFETYANRDISSWLFGTNANLPDDVSVQWVKEVDEEFHARFSAERRIYQYFIFNQPARSALLNNKVVWEPRSLSLEHMQKAAAFLVGTHDFSAYRSLTCQANTPVRTIHNLTVKRKAALIKIEIDANAFLHHMVRNISGVLMTVGMGRADPDWAREVLQGRDRTLGGITAPPEGLYLLKVIYPSHFNLPSSGVEV